MRTNIVIDDKLMDEAIRAGGLKTKRATIEEALRVYIQFKKQARIRRLRGKMQWRGNLDEMRKGRVVAN
jgi:Arc/MetJ family transcription regulator